jgi:hypothetical protein
MTLTPVGTFELSLALWTNKLECLSLAKKQVLYSQHSTFFVTYELVQ